MKNRMCLIALLAPMLFHISAVSAQPQPVNPVASVDLDRYLGKWFEIARLPNKFQKQCVSDVSANYVKRTDGEIDVINRCKKADGQFEEAIGRARLPDPQATAKLKVRFAPQWLAWLPMVWADYWVLDLAPDYSLAAVGEPTREYVWVLSRTPTIAESDYQALTRRLATQGFDVTRLTRTSHGAAK